MEHVTEKVLGLYAIEPASVANRVALEAHLETCSACRAVLNEIRTFDAALREEETWFVASENETAYVEVHLAELRRFENTMAEEDASAAELLREFEMPDSAARFVWANVADKTSFQTGGVARRLCRMANGMCERMPLYALVLAEAATNIASKVRSDSYPRGTIHELRGDTWKEQANALHYLGRFDDALNALSKAESEYNELRVPGLGLVAVKYLRAGALFEKEQYTAAETLARESADAALALGATDRYMRARHLEALIQFERRQFLRAAEIFREVLAYGEEQNAIVWIARESLGLANCHIELQNAAEAEKHAHQALRLFRELDLAAPATRARWAIARVAWLKGRSIEAIDGHRKVIKELTSLGMLTDAAIACVDLSEILDATGRAREVPKLLAGVVETFTDAGKLTGALTALAYLRDAAAHGRLHPPLLRYAKRFIARTETQPHLLFSPPPPAV